MLLPGIIASQASGGAIFPSATGWWAVDDLVGLSDGANIAAWAGHDSTGGSWGQRASGALPSKETVDGEVVAQFAAASTESLQLSTTLADLIGPTGFCAVAFELLGVPSSTHGTWYLNNGLIGDAGGYWGIAAVNFAGNEPSIRVGVYDGTAPAIRHVLPDGPRHIVMVWRTPGGLLTSSIDGGAEQTIAAGAPSVTSNPMLLGCNYDATVFANVRLLAVVTSTVNGTSQDRTALLERLRADYITRTLNPPAGYELVFSDEFDYTGAPDPTKWVVEAVSQSSYATVANGKLTLRCSGTSEATRIRGSIRTSDSAYMAWWGRGDFNFDHMWNAPGWLEISMKPTEVLGVMSNVVLWTDFLENPPGSGLWELGEIDVVEARGFQPGIMDLATHAWTEPVAGGAEPNTDNSLWINRAQGAVTSVGSDRFHQFVAEWGSGVVKIHVDGRLYHQRDLTGDPYPIFGEPTLLILEAMIAEDNSWGAGEQVVSYPIDTTLEVEHVRFYAPALDLPSWAFDSATIFTPEAFGWTTGGTITANTVALQDAIEAANANSGGGTVQLTAGRVYTVNASIWAYSQVNIRTAGSGLPKASIKLDPAIDAGGPVSFIPVLRVEDVTQFSLRSVIIDGSRDGITNITGTGDAGMFGIKILGGRYVLMHNVEAIEAVTDGLYLDASPTGTPGTNPNYYATDVFALGCRFDLNGRNGVTISGCGRDALTWDQVVFDTCDANQNGDKPASTLGTQPGSGWHFETTYGPTWERYRGISLLNCRGNGNRGSTRINYGAPGSLNWGAGFIVIPATVDAGGQISYLKINTLELDGNRMGSELRLYGEPTGTVITNLDIDGVTISNTSAEPNRLLIWDKWAPPANSTVQGTITNVDADQIELSGLHPTGNSLTINSGPFVPAITTNDLATVTIAGSWTPARFPYLTGWWRSSDLTAVTEGADITAWTKQSGLVAATNSLWSQRAAGAMPDKLTVSSEPFVDFAAAQSESLDMPATLATMIGASGLCAIVFELTAAPTTTSAQWYSNHGLIGDAGGYWGISVDNISSQPHINAGLFDNVGAKKIAHNITVGPRHIFMMWRTPAGVLTSALDGGAEQTLAANEPQDMAYAMQLGCNWSAASFANYRLLAAVTATANGTSADRAALKSYLQTAYNVTDPVAKDGAPQFSVVADSVAATFNHSHTFGAGANALTVMVGVETGDTISSIVIDPASANITMSPLVSAANGVTKIFAYEAHGLAALTGAKVVRITWSATTSKDFRVQSQSYTGAANAAPTPTANGAAATGTSIPLSLTAPNANGILQFGCFINGGSSGVFTATGFTETDDTFTGGGGGVFQSGEKVGSLTSPTNVSTAWTASDRNAAIAFVVNPAGGPAIVAYGGQNVAYSQNVEY